MSWYWKLVIFVIWILVLSALEIIVLSKDKQLAAKGSDIRVPEKNLLLLSALGGALGGLLGRPLLHHKTSGKKWHFYAVDFTALGLEILTLVLFAVIK